LAIAAHRKRRALRGAGLVETMVGILIGLLVVLAVYNLLSTAEGYRRTTTGASDAQVSGLLSQFMLNRDIGNGGNGVLLNGDDNLNYLASCTLDEAGNPDASNRPIPALITDGGAGTIADTIVAFNSGSPRVPWPVNFVDADSLPGTDFVVQSPTGFTSPQPKDARYWVIASVNDGSGRCGRFQITDAVAGPNVALGEVTLKTSPASTLTYTANVSKLINLGPVGQATRVRYESYNSTAGEACGTTDATRPCQLYTTDLMTPGAVRNPVAASVVLLKAQYGVDTDAVPDGRIDCWTPADHSNACGDGKDYRPASVETFSVADLNRIIAIRTAVVVRSDEPDLKDPDLVAAKRPDIVLFNCSLDTDAGCPGRIVLPKGNAGQIIADHWSYRSYETVIPLRNTIFVGTLP
jgi:type IV pilus assembly protein PilW